MCTHYLFPSSYRFWHPELVYCFLVLLLLSIIRHVKLLFFLHVFHQVAGWQVIHAISAACWRVFSASPPGKSLFTTLYGPCQCHNLFIDVRKRTRTFSSPYLRNIFLLHWGHTIIHFNNNNFWGVGGGGGFFPFSILSFTSLATLLNFFWIDNTTPYSHHSAADHLLSRLELITSKGWLSNSNREKPSTSQYMQSESESIPIFSYPIVSLSFSAWPSKCAS